MKDPLVSRGSSQLTLNNMKKLLLTGSVVLLLAAVLQLASCQNTEDAVVTCGSQSPSFSTDVSPIIQATCATNSSCHASGSSRGPGALTSYAQIYANRTSIKSSVSSGRMPEGRTLTSDQKAAIICWIENGAANN